jgi:hypothetical protein
MWIRWIRIRNTALAPKNSYNFRPLMLYGTVMLTLNLVPMPPSYPPPPPPRGGRGEGEGVGDLGANMGIRCPSACWFMVEVKPLTKLGPLDQRVRE